MSFARKVREIAILTWTYHTPGSNGKTSGKLLGQMKMERDVQLVSISLFKFTPTVVPNQFIKTYVIITQFVEYVAFMHPSILFQFHFIP